MNKYYLLFLLLFAGKTVFADQLSGLDNIGTIIIFILIGTINILILLISTIKRFTDKKPKVNIVLNFSGTALIFCSLIVISILGLTNIDPGFLATCIGCIVLSLTLILLNFTIGLKTKTKDNTE